jgi:hypothetical protein
MSREEVQHICNPLHLYCRLVDLGMSPRMAKRLGFIYEKICFSIIKRFTFQKIKVKDHGEIDISVDIKI